MCSLCFLACLKRLRCIGQQLGELKKSVIVILSLIISFIGLYVCPGFANRHLQKDVHSIERLHFTFIFC